MDIFDKLIELDDARRKERDLQEHIHMFSETALEAELTMKGWEDLLTDLKPLRMFEDAKDPQDALDRLELPELKGLAGYAARRRLIEESKIEDTGDTLIFDVSWYVTALLDIKLFQQHILNKGSISFSVGDTEVTVSTINILRGTVFPEAFPNKGRLLLELY